MSAHVALKETGEKQAREQEKVGRWRMTVFKQGWQMALGVDGEANYKNSVLMFKWPTTERAGCSLL